MDAGEPGRGDHARRAAIVMAVALAAILVAAVIYLRPPASPVKRILVGGVQSPTPQWLPGQVMATYDFVSPKLGWSLVTEYQVTTQARFWVFSTTDAARSWRQQFSGTCGSFGAVPSLQFFDRKNGFFSDCAPMQVFRTVDGGAHWASISLPAYSPSLLVTFGDPADGWLATFSTETALVTNFLSTTDGGRTWIPLPVPPVPSATSKGGQDNLEFRSRLEGWMGVAGPDTPTVASTNDGGLSWQPHVLPTTEFQKLSSAEVVLLPGSGVMATTFDHFGNPVAFTSVDGGATWQKLASPPGGTDYTDFRFADATHWWAMHSGILYKSADAGLTWNQAFIALDSYDYQLQVIDQNHAWAQLTSVLPGPPGPGNVAVVDSGLAMTSDGGVSWTYVHTPQPRLS